MHLRMELGSHELFFSPSQGKRPAQSLSPLCWKVREPTGRTRWASGEWSEECNISKNGVGREKPQEERGKEELSCEKGAESTNIY